MGISNAWHTSTGESVGPIHLPEGRIENRCTTNCDFIVRFPSSGLFIFGSLLSCHVIKTRNREIPAEFWFFALRPSNALKSASSALTAFATYVNGSCWFYEPIRMITSSIRSRTLLSAFRWFRSGHWWGSRHYRAIAIVLTGLRCIPIVWYDNYHYYRWLRDANYLKTHSTV